MDIVGLLNILIFIFYVANNGAENCERQFVWKELLVAYLKTVLRNLGHKKSRKISTRKLPSGEKIKGLVKRSDSVTVAICVKHC